MQFSGGGALFGGAKLTKAPPCGDATASLPQLRRP